MNKTVKVDLQKVNLVSVLIVNKSVYLIYRIAASLLIDILDFVY